MSNEDTSENVDSKKKDRATKKQIILLPALHNLINPTAVYLGEELQKLTQSKIEQLKKDIREKNLQAHIDAVNRKLKDGQNSLESNDLSLNKLELFEDWRNCAQEIDPEDKEISDIWQSLLTRALRGDRFPSEVMLTLKTLSPEEAQFLFKFYRKYDGIEGRNNLISFDNIRILFVASSSKYSYLEKSLEKKQILEKDPQYFYRILVSLIFWSFLSFIVIYSADIYYNFVVTKLIEIRTDTRQFLSWLFLGLMITLLIIYWGRSRKLTWLGEELLKSTSKYEELRDTFKRKN